MSAFELSLSSLFSLFIFFIIPFTLLFFVTFKTFTNLTSSTSNKLPKSYPLIGSYFDINRNLENATQWTSEIVTNSPTLTFTLHRPLGRVHIFTANPCNVQHILKTRFDIYQKGSFLKTNVSDLLGNGIFNSDGEVWKFQRQVSSHEFTTKSLRKFVENVVDDEIINRLVPTLDSSVANKTVLDFQDVLQRFAFDNICKISFGYDPAYLSPLLPEAEFAVVFEEAVRISSERFGYFHTIFWKIKRSLNIGSEKKLKSAVYQVRKFAKDIIKVKKQELTQKSSLDSVDLLSRFLSSAENYDEDFVIDIVISFILAGRDTTSAALTWFFWKLSGNPEVETEILKEIFEKDSEDNSVYDEVKEMVYTHASLCESMRLYPPVPVDSKEAVADDVLPDGTVVKKNARVGYHVYAMGRSESLWGSDWAEFRPERWLEREEGSGKWKFVGRDPCVYPVFQAGPRICLGKEMAFLQMKRVVAGVLRRFKVVPVVEQGVEPVLLTQLTSKMKGGFPVRIKRRV